VRDREEGRQRERGRKGWREDREEGKVRVDRGEEASIEKRVKAIKTKQREE
jgi:hypothetical protein